MDTKELLERYVRGERDFRHADLTGADLTGADLTGADLRRADLTDADLTDADLTDANLTGADLRRADLPEGFHCIQVGPVGSRQATTCAYVYPDGNQVVRTGCFEGSFDQFITAIHRKSEGDPYRKEYEMLVIPLLATWFMMHKPAKTEVATHEPE